LQEEETIEKACKENGKDIGKNKKGKDIVIIRAVIRS
jgi:hypothetical protein